LELELCASCGVHFWPISVSICVHLGWH
jgi:hypothetical protein